MIKWWEQFSKRPLVAHVVRTVERFNLRGGPQLAAAIAYFSVLSVVPILMFAFSVLGMTLTVFQPAALDQVVAWVTSQLQGNDDLVEQIVATIDGALRTWPTTLAVAMAVGFWFGSNWFGNLKRAVRLVMRADVDTPGKVLVLPLDILSNFAGLIAVLLGILLTFGASSIATTLTDLVGHTLGLSGVPGWGILLRVVSLVVAFAAGTGLFWVLFVWFTPEPLPGGSLWMGAAAGGAVLVGLQALTGYLIQAFSGNLSAGVFGSVIVLMLFLNLFATLILFIAAWLATEAAPADPQVEPEPVVEEVPVETRPGELYVSSAVAEKSLGVGLGTGYVVGAATGLGLGAILIGGLKSLFGSRRR